VKEQNETGKLETIFYLLFISEIIYSTFILQNSNTVRKVRTLEQLMIRMHLSTSRHQVRAETFMNSFISSQKVMISFFGEPALAIKNPKCVLTKLCIGKCMTEVDIFINILVISL
jgi:hypothetical protein